MQISGSWTEPPNRSAYGYCKYTHFKNCILLISWLYVSGRKETKQELVA